MPVIASGPDVSAHSCWQKPCDLIVALFLTFCWGVTTISYQHHASCKEDLQPGGLTPLPSWEVPCTMSVNGKFCLLLLHPLQVFSQVLKLPVEEFWMVASLAATILWLCSILFFWKAYDTQRTAIAVAVRLLPKAIPLATLLALKRPLQQLSYYQLYVTMDGPIILWYSLAWRLPPKLELFLLATDTAMTCVACLLISTRHPMLTAKPMQVAVMSLCWALLASSKSWLELARSRCQLVAVPVGAKTPSTVVQHGKGQPKAQPIVQAEANQNTAGQTPVLVSHNDQKAGVSAIAHKARAKEVLAAVMQQRNQPYHSAMSKDTLYMKIPFIEPEDLPEDFLDKIQAQLAAKTCGQYTVTNASVRRGCVELVLDVLHAKPHCGTAGGTTATSRPEHKDGAGSSLRSKADAEELDIVDQLPPSDWVHWLYLQPPKDAEVLVQACGRSFITSWDSNKGEWLTREVPMWVAPDGTPWRQQPPQVTSVSPSCLPAHRGCSQATSGSKGLAVAGASSSTISQEAPVVVQQGSSSSSTGSNASHQITLTGLCLDGPDVKVAARFYGRYLPVQRLNVTRAGVAPAAAHPVGGTTHGMCSITISVSGLDSPGLLLLECWKGNLLFSRKQVVVMDKPGVVSELQRLDGEDAGERKVADLMTDLGCWVEFMSTVQAWDIAITSATPSVPGTFTPAASPPLRSSSGTGTGSSSSSGGQHGQPRAQDSLEVLASRPLLHACKHAGYQQQMVEAGMHLLAHCCSMGWPATASCLLEDLLDLGYTFAQLKQVMISEGMTLLHRAVCSGSQEMVGTVVQWGQQYDEPWSWSEADPSHGITPLHVAAIVPSPSRSMSADHVMLANPVGLHAGKHQGGTLADWILREYEAAWQYWHGATDAMGSTPADIAEANAFESPYAESQSLLACLSDHMSAVAEEGGDLRHQGVFHHDLVQPVGFHGMGQQPVEDGDATVQASACRAAGAHAGMKPSVGDRGSYPKVVARRQGGHGGTSFLSRQSASVCSSVTMSSAPITLDSAGEHPTCRAEGSTASSAEKPGAADAGKHQHVTTWWQVARAAVVHFPDAAVEQRYLQWSVARCRWSCTLMSLAIIVFCSIISLRNAVNGTLTKGGLVAMLMYSVPHGVWILLRPRFTQRHAAAHEAYFVFVMLMHALTRGMQAARLLDVPSGVREFVQYGLDCIPEGLFPAISHPLRFTHEVSPRILLTMVVAALYLRLSSSATVLWAVTWNASCLLLSLVMDVASRRTFLKGLGGTVRSQ